MISLLDSAKYIACNSVTTCTILRYCECSEDLSRIIGDHMYYFCLNVNEKVKVSH
jgi:hypothetical protein